MDDNKDTTSLESLLRGAVERGAGDIHFEPFDGGIRIRERVRGELHDIDTVLGTDAQRIISRVKVMADMDVTERRRPQDGALRADCGGVLVNARVSSLPTLHGERLALRILDMRPLKSLGMSEAAEESFSRIMQMQNGLVLIAGPIGSGKTTTMYEALRGQRRGGNSVVTLEDPVEYDLDGVCQTHVSESGPVTFDTAIRAVLRQDPDVIAIGEIRTGDAADAALLAASTGRLTFATIHARRAAAIPDRFAAFGVSERALYGALRAVIVQRLCRRGNKVTGAFGIAVSDDGEAFAPSQLIDADSMLEHSIEAVSCGE